MALDIGEAEASGAPAEDGASVTNGDAEGSAEWDEDGPAVTSGPPQPTANVDSISVAEATAAT